MSHRNRKDRATSGSVSQPALRREGRLVLPGRAFWFAVLIVALTIVAYAPVRQAGFLAFDDRDYVVNNPPVAGGLTWSGVGWAFTSGHSFNWHPVTWLSHMLDCELFGLNAGWHHLVSLGFEGAIFDDFSYEIRQ